MIWLKNAYVEVAGVRKESLEWVCNNSLRTCPVINKAQLGRKRKLMGVTLVDEENTANVWAHSKRLDRDQNFYRINVITVN